MIISYNIIISLLLYTFLCDLFLFPVETVCFGNRYIKTETKQGKLVWPLPKEGTQLREAFQYFSSAGTLNESWMNSNKESGKQKNSIE